MKKTLAGRSLNPLKRRVRPAAATLLALLLTLTTLTMRTRAADGLDPTFGVNGLVVTDFGTTETADHAAVQADGKIVVVGAATRFGDVPFETVTDFVLARLNPDGTPDNTFGAGGRVTTRFPGADRADARGAAAQPDGKLILTGYVEAPLPRAQGNIYDIAVARYGATPAAEPTSFARFSAQTYGAAEGCAATTVTVTREGDLSAPAAVEYRTRDISARQLFDYRPSSARRPSRPSARAATRGARRRSAASSRPMRSTAGSTTRASSSRSTSATCAATRTRRPTSTSRATTSGSPSSTTSACPARTCATSAWR